MRRIPGILLLLTAPLLLGGCGQKGPLFLPPPKPVQSAPAASTPSPPLAPASSVPAPPVSVESPAIPQSG